MITERTSNARSTSGTAEQLASDREPMTSASTRRTPSAASEGTIVREPASGSPRAPASRITVVPGVRMSEHEPRLTAIESTITSLPSKDVRAEQMVPESKPATITAATAPANQRHRRLGLIHATTIATSIAAAHVMPGRPVAEVEFGCSAATDAIHASDRTHSTETDPAHIAAVPRTPCVAIAIAPPMVASAAAGIVTTLSGAASHEIDPAWCRAIGVLTLQATSDAHTDPIMAETAISGSSGTRPRA